MTFTPADLIALFAGVAALVTAVGTSVAQIITARSSRQKLTEISAKADDIGKKVDGAASASVSTIEGLRHEITLLHGVAAEKKETAALLAQAAVRPPDPASAPTEPATHDRRAGDAPASDVGAAIAAPEAAPKP
jgi:hypothetical protein